MGKQLDMIGGPSAELDSKYSKKIATPIYQVKGRKPFLVEMLNETKALELIKEIEESDITEEEKHFLIEAAKRHNVFNYSKIADYYAHSGPEMQALMERSALVIIDIGKAIEWGYVKLAEEIAAQYLEDSKDE